MRVLNRWRRALGRPAPRLAVSLDVTRAYQLFLGRDPESEKVVRDRAAGLLEGLLSSLASSDEFGEAVLEPVERRAAFQAPTFATPPDRAFLSWVADVLEAPAAGEACDWPELWRILLAGPTSGPRLRRWAPRLGAPAFLDALQAMENRSVAGAIEEVRRDRVRGWALDPRERSRRLAIELTLDGRNVGEGRTGGFRNDLQERFGGDGRYGFEIAVLEHMELAGGEFALCEAGSGRPFAAGVSAPSAQARAAELRALREELQALGERRADLERRVEQARAARGFPLERYASYVRALAAEAERTPPGEEDAGRLRPRLLVISIGGAGAAGFSENLERQGYRNFVIAESGGLPQRLADFDAVVLPGAGELLSSQALHGVTEALQRFPRPQLITADADHHASDAAGGPELRDPVLRGAYDPERLLQEAPGPGLLVASGEALGRALDGGASLEPVARHDLQLRLEEIVPEGARLHLPRVLSHVAVGGRPTSPHLPAVRSALARRGAAAEVERASDPLGGTYDALRIRWPLPPGTRLAAIIPTRDRPDLIGPCLRSIHERREANGAALEVLVVDNSDEPDRLRNTLAQLGPAGDVRVVPWPGPFNWAALNNDASREVEADVLIFLNDDTRAITPDWSDELARQALRPGVGVVGARLLYEGGSVQHAGVVLAGGHIDHEAVGASADDPGYLGRNRLVRRVSAVTGACLATPASVFEALGGFDQDAFPIEGNDIDYCLRAERRGLATLYDPWCALYHLESKTRGHSTTDRVRERRSAAAMMRLRRRWGERLEVDPWYPPAFDRGARPFTQLAAPLD